MPFVGFCLLWGLLGIFPVCQFPLCQLPSLVNFPLCQLPTLVNFPLRQFPLWSTSHLVNVDKVGIDEVGSWQSGNWLIHLKKINEKWDPVYIRKLDVGMRLTVWWMCWPLYTACTVKSWQNNCGLALKVLSIQMVSASQNFSILTKWDWQVGIDEVGNWPNGNSWNGNWQSGNWQSGNKPAALTCQRNSKVRKGLTGYDGPNNPLFGSLTCN